MAIKSVARSSEQLVMGFVVAVVGLGATSCGQICKGHECDFTETEWSAITALGPLPEPPIDPTNMYEADPRAVSLGHKLFFDKRYSGALKMASTLGAIGDTGKVSCASCHDPANFFIDTRSKPSNISTGVSYTLRNAPSLVNVAYYQWHGWAGKQRTLWQQAASSPETGSNSAGDRCGYAHMVFSFHRTEYEALFSQYPLPAALDAAAPDAARFPLKCKPKSKATDPDGAWEKMADEDRVAVQRIMANQGKAVAAYERKLVSRFAPFDAYLAGNEKAITDEAKRGLKLFVGKAACIDCHSGAFFTDQSFHNVGVPQTGPNVAPTDEGRFEDVAELLKHPFVPTSKFSDNPGVTWMTGVAQSEGDRGKFRTKSLRSVAKTAPYMHTGDFATLRDVVVYYNNGGATSGFSGVKDPRMKPLLLSESEIAELVAFLNTLTGQPPPAELSVDPFAP